MYWYKPTATNFWYQEFYVHYKVRKENIFSIYFKLTIAILHYQSIFYVNCKVWGNMSIKSETFLQSGLDVYHLILIRMKYDRNKCIFYKVLMFNILSYFMNYNFEY